MSLHAILWLIPIAIFTLAVVVIGIRAHLVTDDPSMKITCLDKPGSDGPRGVRIEFRSADQTYGRVRSKERRPRVLAAAQR